ncbi:MAG TPA: hypothetical protein VFQ76_02970 [Longimicrobiaceae bacterium]|nr:hypothetical protein [Longimicrobiaceae bacterium]
MFFRGSEDRLNPVAPEGADDTTLGGYRAVHGRSPAFEGADGEPYTVAVETDATDEAEEPAAAYLVFVRWSRNGTAVMGHLETGDRARGRTEEEARGTLEAWSLARVKQVLDEAIRERGGHG